MPLRQGGYYKELQPSFLPAVHKLKLVIRSETCQSALVLHAAKLYEGLVHSLRVELIKCLVTLKEIINTAFAIYHTVYRVTSSKTSHAIGSVHFKLWVPAVEGCVAIGFLSSSGCCGHFRLNDDDATATYKKERRKTGKYIYWREQWKLNKKPVC